MVERGREDRRLKGKARREIRTRSTRRGERREDEEEDGRWTRLKDRGRIERVWEVRESRVGDEGRAENVGRKDDWIRGESEKKSVVGRTHRRRREARKKQTRWFVED